MLKAGWLGAFQLLWKLVENDAQIAKIRGKFPRMWLLQIVQLYIQQTTNLFATLLSELVNYS